MRRRTVFIILFALTLGMVGCIAILDFEDFDTRSVPTNTVTVIEASAAPDDDVVQETLRVVEITPPQVVLVRGKSTTLDVRVERGTGFNEALVVKVPKPPTGVAIAEMPLEPSASKVTLNLVVAQDAPIVITPLVFEVVVASVSSPTERRANTQYVVHGAPGTRDDTFGDGGVADIIMSIVVDAGGADADAATTTTVPTDDAYALAIASDGKIIVGGSRTTTRRDGLLARLSREGALDTTFGDGGAMTTVLPSGPSTIVSVAIQVDGKIVTVGYDAPKSTTLSQGTALQVARHESNGAPDALFGTNANGRVDVAIPVIARKLAIAPNGRINVISTHFVNASTEVFRLDAFGVGGNRDLGFADAGTFEWSLFGMMSDGYTLTIPGDGGILAVGQTNLPDPYPAIVKVTTSGAIDLAFGGSGYTSLNQASPTRGRVAMALAPNGEMVLVTESDVSDTNHSLVLARFASDGTLVKAFGNVGYIFQPFTKSPTEELRFDLDIAMQSDGKFVVAGMRQERIPVGVMYRYEAGGVLDQGFGTNGNAADIESLVVRAIALDAEGRIVVTGSRSKAVFVARYWN